MAAGFQFAFNSRRILMPGCPPHLNSRRKTSVGYPGTRQAHVYLGFNIHPLAERGRA
jgi:hypothetical protein